MDTHFIVLNGKRYDAVTGALLGPATNSQLPAQPRKVVANPHLSRLQPSAKPAAHGVVAAPAAPRPRPDRAHHLQPKPAIHHKPEPAKTLMRRAVHKPETSAGKLPVAKRQYPLAAKASVGGISPKLSVSTIDHHRALRAQSVQKSAQVGKFSHAPTPVTPQLQPITVAAAPAHIAHIPSAPAITQEVQEVAKKASHIFEQAIANATGHEEPVQKSKKQRKAPRKLVSTLAALGAVFIIGGFLAYANKATVQLQVASVKAGFQASMPSYAPEGFQRQAAHASNGAVAINFISPMSNKSFALTQESSDWDSQTLFDSVVAQSDSSYQTVQSNGRTIYIYGNDQAAWVDGGILYKVSGNSGLSSDQVISLAASM